MLTTRGSAPGGLAASSAQLSQQLLRSDAPSPAPSRRGRSGAQLASAWSWRQAERCPAQPGWAGRGFRRRPSHEFVWVTISALALDRGARRLTRRRLRRVQRCAAATAGSAVQAERFSVLATESFAAAFRAARQLGHVNGESHAGAPGIGTDHILLGMALTPQSAAGRALSSVGVAASSLETALLELRPAGEPQAPPSAMEQLKPPLTPEAAFYLRRASRMLSWMPRSGEVRVLGTEHVLLGLLSNGSHAAQRLLLTVDNEGFDRAVVKFDSGAGGAASNPRRSALRTAVMKLVNNKEGDSQPHAMRIASGAAGAAGAAGPTLRSNRMAQGDALSRFAPDLTALAERGALDPFIGRSHVVEQVERALGRRRKRSVVLVGDPGVGKTALVEAIAQRIVGREAPPWLLERRVHSLDVAALTAGTRLRGDFEERLGVVLADAEAAGVVLFIDEAHTLVGAGATASSPLDAADMLKPTLARGTLQCIAATTVEEYRSRFATDAAFERRFEVVEVEEPSPEDTAEILSKLGPRYEEYHKVTFAPGALAAAAEWSARHLPERRLPDKAIDVVDRAAVRARSSAAGQEGQPIASLLLYGPPGVGKTSLATALAEVWLGSRRMLIRVDCASARSAEAAGLALAAAVRRRPHAVVLVDEADKADDEFLGYLLEVLENGSLTMEGPGAPGRADFRHCVMLLTANDPRGPGALPRALADRLDASVECGALTSEALEEVLQGFLSDVQQRLSRSAPGAVLRTTEAWREAALQRACSGASAGEELGARALRRAVRTLLEDPLALALLNQQDPAAEVLADVSAEGKPRVLVS